MQHPTISSVTTTQTIRGKERFSSSVSPDVTSALTSGTGADGIFLADYFTDSCYQALAYWIMSAMTNDPFTLARYAGFYKAIQSAVSPFATLTVPLTLILFYF
jgi:hypothetical protein